MTVAVYAIAVAAQLCYCHVQKATGKLSISSKSCCCKDVNGLQSDQISLCKIAQNVAKLVFRQNQYITCTVGNK
jgi:hypothetical protein